MKVFQPFSLKIARPNAMKTHQPLYVFVIVFKCTNQLQWTGMSTPWGKPWGIQAGGFIIVHGGNSPKSSLYFSHWICDCVVDTRQQKRDTIIVSNKQIEKKNREIIIPQINSYLYILIQSMYQASSPMWNSKNKSFFG